MKTKFLEKKCVRKILNLRLWFTHGSVPAIIISVFPEHLLFSPNLPLPRLVI